jgi:hypothetical protein
LSSAKADTIVDISYAFGSFNLQAEATVTPVTGQFMDLDGLILITGTEDEVLSMTGNLNGSPISYTLDPTNPSWIGLSLFVGGPGLINFSADGVSYSLFSTFACGDECPNHEVLTSTGPIVDTPEPTLFVLLATSLLLIGFALMVKSAFR